MTLLRLGACGKRMCAQQRERGRAPHRLLVLDELDLHALARDAAAHPPRLVDGGDLVRVRVGVGVGVRVRVRVRVRIRVRVRVIAN